METKADQDFFQKWVWIVALLVPVLIIVEAFLSGLLQDGHLQWPVLLLKVAAAVIPNFIAALVSVLLVYLFVRDNNRANYVRAMRSLRSAVQELLQTGKVQPADVRTLMKKFVPAVSLLYFNSDQPKAPDADASVTYNKDQCFACGQPCPVFHGRCSECRDIISSWRQEEQPRAPR